MLLTLNNGGITTANLIDTAGGNTFTVGGWTHGGTLTGSSGIVTASNASNYTLSNASLSSNDKMSLTLSGITTANLTTTATGQTFTVNVWTGTGTFTGTSATVTASEASGFTLTNSELKYGGSSLNLVGFLAANLTDTSSGGNTFTITGWTGRGTLSGSSETLVKSVSASVTLTNASLAGTGLATLNLNGFTTADLTDTGSGNTFTVSGWTGAGTLAGSVDTLTASKAFGFTLSNTSLASGDGMSLGLSGFGTANLTDTHSGDTFTISGWTGIGTLKGASSETVDDVAAGGYTLTNSTLKLGTMSLSLTGFTVANLSDTNAGDTFTVTNWTGSGSLTGVSDAVAETVSNNVTLSNSKLTVGTVSLTLSGISTANLTDTASGLGHPSYILDASGFSAGPANLTVSGTVSAIVFGGTAGHDALTVAAGASGKIVLIGNGPDDTLTDNSSGSNILIGAGTGGDTITGNGEDILIGGKTIYDSNTSAHITALDAILAEWTSTDSYATKISKIMSGVGSGAYAFNSSTIAPDANANTLSDGSSQTANTNWFLASNQDTVNKKSGETETII